MSSLTKNLTNSQMVYSLYVINKTNYGLDLSQLDSISLFVPNDQFTPMIDSLHDDKPSHGWHCD